MSIATVLTGAAFGASLVASGVFQPSVILSQFRLENWHMTQAFLTATASSALFIALFQALGSTQLKPRNFSSQGLFAHYDGNLFGGLLLGHGMALAGACPGTVLSQVALGLPSGYLALAGATLGGIVWTGFLASASPAAGAAGDRKLAIHQVLGVSRGAALLAFEALLFAVVAGTAAWTTAGPEAVISPVLGGLLLGGTQLLSLAARGSLVGVSTSYEEVGEWFWRAVRGEAPRKYTSILFSLGILAGSWSVARLFPSLAVIVEVDLEPSSAVTGGFLMVVGSRMAGGCTSGHGISGMSLLSVSSFITMGAAFGWGAAVARFQ
ncbi:YeeE/YedE family protein [Phialemonium atrogriseum]|uniref:YeeE/YedE family protein n=1 Tax=Phialemonium atrogriseum TaxID=1093897 RepID=A0AAJ0C3D1_9PEZI|nr:YeeE/YedE family protein [Phialemonium atrogriseum]KAK1767989.1 YeeE/YedE family protein [Phialemonium atrogriseum]